MSLNARSPPDIAALESCFVAVKAPTNFNAKPQGAGISPRFGTSLAPSAIYAKTQPAGGISCAGSIAARYSTPDASGRDGTAREVQKSQSGRPGAFVHALIHRSTFELPALFEPQGQRLTPMKLPPVLHGRSHTKGQSSNVATHLKKSRVKHLSPPRIFITPSTLEENGQEDEFGNVSSSICVGLGASGIDLFENQFNHLESVDLGDNKLQFADASIFPGLRLLNMYCNGIKSLHHPETAFKCLEVLNLSFNIINQDDLAPLFAIKSLVVLDLSFNMISRIPNRWHSLPHLKILSFEKNGLHHEETFMYLSLAPSLQELNLSSNKLSCVPASCSAPGRFPELLVLSLVDNQFFHEKDVVALSFVPSIQQVDLWNNPMSSNSDVRARSKRTLRRSRSPSPEVLAKKPQSPNALLHEGFLRVMTPANFEPRGFAPESRESPSPALSFSSRPKRALADIEREAQAVFRNGMASINPQQQSLASTTANLRKLKSILNASLVGSNDSVILTCDTTVANPTLCLIERMKAVGADIERRKQNAPDRFFSHFYFGPESKSPSGQQSLPRKHEMHSDSIKRMLTAVKQQFRAAAHNGPKHQVIQGTAAMERALHEAGAVLPTDASEDSNIRKWPGFDGD